MGSERGPAFVLPGFKFVFDPATDTVETHRRIKSCDGSVRWEITDQATATTFLGGEEEYVRCAHEIRMHRAREIVATMPKRRASAE